MSGLALRRGTVVSVDPLVVDVGGRHREAVVYEHMTGPAEVGDEVVVNVAARDLGLGSGGFDVVHVNLTRGLGGTGEPDAHVMKLNYTSLQHAVEPLEERAPEQAAAAVGTPVAVVALHAQLPCVAWAATRSAPDARIGFVQTWGGALPGPLSRVVAQLVERGLLAGHVTAGAAFGGEHDAVTLPGALHAAATALGWDGIVAGPGPGIVGSATTLGHGGLAALESAHSALALGMHPIVVPRMSSGDARERHRGLSHHTRTVLDLLLRPVVVALPEGETVDLPGEHRVRIGAADLDGYGASGLPATTMGRAIEQDELFFRAALAGGAVLAEELNGVRARRS
jgi:hypothetical protein